MSIDFSKYKNIIQDFRGEVIKPGFDIKFTQHTTELDKTEKFLLKMELKRLAGACTRSIDLRGLVDGECELFEYCGQSHFLDNIAVSVFKENAEKYKGYTFGVYESVKNTENNFRVIYQKEQQKINNVDSQESSVEWVKKNSDKIQYPVQVFSLNQRYTRVEERMNFVIALDVEIPNQQIIPASSIDISISGLKFRFKCKESLSVNEKIIIRFQGLASEFKGNEGDKLVYQVKNIYSDNNTHIIGCQRTDYSEDDAFQSLLTSYIQTHKRRYKINLDHSMTALQSRSFEQAILPKINELPLFFEQINKRVIPRYALTTQNNKATFQYWQDEDNYSNLHSLVNEERLTRLRNKHQQGNGLLVYSFVHRSQGKDFFYTIDEDQLAFEVDFIPAFFTFAAKKKSFTITKLTYHPINMTSIYSPFIISSDSEYNQQGINLPPSEEVLDRVKALSFCVVVNVITHTTSMAQYQHFSQEKIDVSTLKRFGHKRLNDKPVVEELGINYEHIKLEPRFIYKTQVVLTHIEQQWQGKSIDFSVSGLKVELEERATFSVGDIIFITFPQLQKITSSHDLKNLTYEVVNIQNKHKVINFRVHIKSHKHVGRSFFKLLIDKNKDKLTADQYSLLVPGLAESLRTLYAQSMQVPTLIVQTSGSRYKVEALVNNNEHNSFLQQLDTLSDRKGFYNFYPLLTVLFKDNFLDTCLKKLTTNSQPFTDVLYIAIAKNVAKINIDVNIKLELELNTPLLRENFIKTALANGVFFCMQCKISRTNKPDLAYLHPELSYISTYAMHRSKQIEQDIFSVAAAIQCFDITDEVLYSHRLSS